jgi:uncharacterized protein YkwD
VTRQTALLLRGLALLWIAPALVFLVGNAALARSPSPGSPALRRAVACPGQGDASAPAGAQLRAMRCLLDRARAAHGLPVLAVAPGLSRAAGRKSADILRCDEFSHEACGREFSYWIRRFGFFDADCSGVAENIAWGTGTFATPGSIFRAWMHSPEHRRNILGPLALTGLGVRVGSLEGRSGAHVWTQEFAARGC